MTQEDKELLLKDLSARLPYKPIVQIEGSGIWALRGIDHDDSAELRDRVIVWHGKNYPSSVNSFPIIECKPFLYPLSSMTEEQKVIYGDYCYEIMHSIAWDGQFCSNELYEWLNKNHFDYHWLIEKGLAIDATNLNVY